MGDSRSGLETKVRRRDFHGWRMVWMLGVTETISYGVLMYAVAVFLTPMRADLHASLGVLAGAVSLSLAVTGLAAPLVGKWLDLHGPRLLMTVGSLLGAISVVGWSFARSLTELYLAFFGIGLAAAAVFYEPAFATINRWFDKDRRAALLTLTVIAGFASTIFLPVSQLLIDHLGWRHALLVLAALVALCAIPHALFLRHTPRHYGLTRDGDPVAPDHLASDTPSADKQSAVRVAWGQPAVRWLTVAAVASTIAVTVVSVHLVTYLHTRDYSPRAAAVGAGALGIMSVAGRVLLTSLARRVRLARLTAVIVAGQALGVAALVWLPHLLGLITFILAFGAGFGVMTIARVALLGEYIDPAIFARVSGIQALASNAGRVLAPVTAGLVIGATGSYGLTLAAVAACSIIAAIALLAADLASVSDRTSDW